MRHRLVSALIALVFGAAAQAQTAEFIQTFTWPKTAHNLGGFSGLEISLDGARFVAISDAGVALYGTVSRGARGIETLTIDRRRGLVPKPRKNPDRLDAEGLAVTRDGTLYVSFERIHRVERFGRKGLGTVLQADGPFARMAENAGFEALAIDHQGRLLAIPERSGRINRDFTLWRYDGGWSAIATLPRDSAFLPVGADIGPDGRLYVLERAFPGFGFRSRVRSFVLNDQGLGDARLHLQSPIWQFDNLEGLSVCQDIAGRIRLTMISDDNFKAIQSTQLVEFALPLASAQANR